MPENIGGTVIQRSFIGRGVASIIHIATVPSDEVGGMGTPFEDLISELLGVPRESVLTDQDYSKVAEGLRTNSLDHPWAFWHPLLEGEYARFVQNLPSKASARAFIGDFVSLIGRPNSPSSAFPFLHTFLPREGATVDIRSYMTMPMISRYPVYPLGSSRNAQGNCIKIV